MEISIQIYTSVALSPRKELRYQMDGWMTWPTEQLWTRWREKNRSPWEPRNCTHLSSVTLAHHRESVTWTSCDRVDRHPIWQRVVCAAVLCTESQYYSLQQMQFNNMHPFTTLSFEASLTWYLTN